MRSGGLVLLVGLLALWTELTPTSGRRPAEKPGQCPGGHPGMVGPCVVWCENDWSCPGAQKCCGNCPRACTVVVREKPGRCPPIRPGTVGPCIAKCSNDWSCPGVQKCCGGCPRKCRIPV
ncbi:WAP four-disulfide core domain protein 18-like [Lacerta agilis]|uniref:WAP four-disulfide core domain protein 18-like n=1 Tax=Lacerta agilis TaxID=80427 RepID=UPI001419BD92|nr:WAP four-disulfide core domain protein 18-like [Lacerta agilis]